MRRNSDRKPLGVLAIVLSIAMTVGCGGKETGQERATISGSVTFNGEPIEKGIIEFIPTGSTKGPTSGGPIKNGKYDITEKGPTMGPHKVLIRATRNTGKMVDAGPQTGGAKVEETEQYIPAQYNIKTTLEVTILSGINKQDFNLNK
ncbi:hypothetical protein [Gimesia aquarii]|uniref:Carboxypeptidase regulatory-like domain-containing protein n=1 Tax=Gimesia aquarii TaxID=2527964 RepID=A0A517VSG7_9PLAN|nr:hypothetical protein [Gimesia aquarii]QDT95947.1 hypothetical protein V144x_13970 [Gimesia aquarii]